MSSLASFLPPRRLPPSSCPDLPDCRSCGVFQTSYTHTCILLTTVARATRLLCYAFYRWGLSGAVCVCDSISSFPCLAGLSVCLHWSPPRTATSSVRYNAPRGTKPTPALTTGGAGALCPQLLLPVPSLRQDTLLEGRDALRAREGLPACTPWALRAIPHSHFPPARTPAGAARSHRPRLWPSVCVDLEVPSVSFFLSHHTSRGF